MHNFNTKPFTNYSFKKRQILLKLKIGMALYCDPRFHNKSFLVVIFNHFVSKFGPKLHVRFKRSVRCFKQSKVSLRFKMLQWRQG
jgi:hypothetical protein